MALTLLKDESELESYITSNPTSYIVVKGYFYAGLDPTVIQQYKNVLTAANNDKLSILKTVSVNAAFEVNFNLNSSVLTVNSYILSNSSLSQRVFISSTTGVVGATGVGGRFLFINGVNVSNSTDLRLHVGSKITITGLFTGGLDVDFLGGAPFQSSDIALLDFTLDGETFSLNEPSGSAFTGGLGTAGTRVTSSLDPDYINDVMIQPYTP